MNPIDHLQTIVTPKVLSLIGEHGGDDTAKRNALTGLFGLFGVNLANPDIASRVQALTPEQLEDGNHVLNTVVQDTQGTTQVSTLNNELATEHGLSHTTTEALTNAAAPLIVHELNTLAGSNSLAIFLQEKADDFAGFLPNWAEKLLPAGLLTGTSALGATSLAGITADATSIPTTPVTPTTEKVSDPATAHVNGQVQPIKKEEGSFMKALLPIIGLVIFAGLAWLLLRGCQEKPAPVATPVTPPAETAPAAGAVADLAPATLNFATDETGQGIYSCRGEAGSEGVFANIRTALSGVFGVADDKCQLNVSSNVADSLPAGEHLEGIFKVMKGVPNSSVSISDKTIRFNAANADDITKLIDGTKALVPADFVVEAEPQLDVASAVSNSINTAKNTISGLTDTATADDLVRALNLQIINFANDSSEIPAENKEILDLAATKLAKLPDARLTITGHTDSNASHEYNKTLSEQRAKAVHDYLVSKGVPDERLDIFGASFDHPVATNATEQGRFQNRRIEFTLIQDGEQIAAVGNAPTSPATAVEEAQQAPADKTAETAEPTTDTAPESADASAESK
ncbi:OmpA family protein [Moraxella bovis]|uniref:OmpA family protein n=1 Tax=Moraxella bovis TaxID=476 RepID=UPI0022269C01|nr:OmpA family protein [Moraxella bovis]UYZ69150.1 OmpA family protein [Moraxella bovis]UYZ71523.1 OmpA family protein [Moraxella bovis]UYZ72563.1 OmpA family protein [Moraxella bovis]UZA14818.1 OmpA family protein [Moraxella bovis]UZA38648.1 OmpA family protein [Moraxella bovis]